MIRFQCIGCGHRYNVPVADAGKRARCNSCQQTFTVPNHAHADTSTWIATDVPKSVLSFSGLPLTLKIGLPVLGCLLLYSAFIIGTAEPRKLVAMAELTGPAAASSPTKVASTGFDLGEDVVLQSQGGGYVYLTPTSDDWNEWIEHSVRNDDDGLQLMIAQGRLLPNASGTPAKFLNYGLDGYEVRIKGGKHTGKSGWVLKELVAKVSTTERDQPTANEPLSSVPPTPPPVPHTNSSAAARSVKPNPTPELPARNAAATTSNEDFRARWLNDTYKDRIVRRDGTRAWQEVDSNTGAIIWEERETSRTKDYVEVFCPKRNYEIRIFADRMELKQDGKWTWVANGRWVDTR